MVCFIFLYFSLSLSLAHTQTHTPTHKHTLETPLQHQASLLSVTSLGQKTSPWPWESPQCFAAELQNPLQTSLSISTVAMATTASPALTAKWKTSPRWAASLCWKASCASFAFKSGFFTFCFSSQALYGTCKVKDGELVASWTLKGTSLSDNGTRVTCQGSEGTEAPAAILHVYGKDSVTFQNRVFQFTWNWWRLKNK